MGGQIEDEADVEAIDGEFYTGRDLETAGWAGIYAVTFSLVTILLLHLRYLLPVQCTTFELISRLSLYCVSSPPRRLSCLVIVFYELTIGPRSLLTQPNEFL